MTKEYQLGLYEKAMPNELSLKEKLEYAKQAGYDFVELSVDETDEKLARLDWTKEEREEVVRMMDEVGLRFRSMCLSGHRKYPLGSAVPETEARSLEIMEKAVRLADDLGIPIIQLAGYDVYYEDSDETTKARFLKNLKKSTEMAAAYGIILGFETMETEFMNTVEKSMKYVTLVNSPYLGVYPDIGNLTNAAKMYKNDVLEDLELGRGHIVAMHIKETVPGKFREIPYNTGHVDFEAGVQKAWDLGVRRFVTEFWYTGNEDWVGDLKRTREQFGELIASMA